MSHRKGSNLEEKSGIRGFSISTADNIPQFTKILPLILPMIQQCYELWESNKENLIGEKVVQYLLISSTLASQFIEDDANLKTIDYQQYEDKGVPQLSNVIELIVPVMTQCQSIWTLAQINSSEYMSLFLGSIFVINEEYLKS